MRVGVFLVILGAVLAFAVRRDAAAIDLQTTGLIFMVAGATLIWFGRGASVHEREVTTTDDLSNPDRPVHTVHESVVDRDPFGDPPRR